MPKEVMRRRGSDNEYLHRDFHGALSFGLIYLQEQYGEDAVREYLRQFARRYYAPVSEALRERGLEVMAERIEHIHDIEGGEVRLELSDDELTVHVERCPAVTHIRGQGHDISPLWRETIRQVNEAICEGTAFDFELMEYDEQTGARTERFVRRDDDDEEGSA